MHRVLDAADRAEARADRAKEPPREGRGRLSSVDQLPEEAQEDVLWAVAELNKREKTQTEILFELNDRLAAKDIDPISRSAFNRKSMKLAAMSNRLNEARHIFSGLAPQFRVEKQDESTVVLGEFIKLLCFELVQSEGGEIGPKGAMELARAHLAVVQGQKVSADRRAAIEAKFKKDAAAAIDKVVRARGMSAELSEDLRRQLFNVPREAADGP